MRCRPPNRWLAALVLPVLSAAAVFAAPAKKPPPETPWSIAEAARAQLAAILPEQRTAADYRTVMDAYRLIYHADPGDLHAPESIYAVGNLLAEEGIVLREPHALQLSLGQYEFLRKQYPTSSLRIAALLEEAHVAVVGLKDNRLAREKYAEFLKEYPRSARIPEAQAALVSLKTGALPVVQSGPLARPAQSDISTDTAGAGQTGKGSTGVQTSGSNSSNSAGTGSGSNPRAAKNAGNTLARNAAAPSAGAPDTSQPFAAALAHHAASSAASNGVPSAAVAPGERAEASLLASERKATPAQIAHEQQPRNAVGGDAPSLEETANAAPKGPTHTRGGMALVTGIRHWSTPTYTRVAIDLGDEVQYQAARVPHPDRIFFDLHGTRLATELVGKSFEVVDDGFLKRIRAAQYTGDSTRIVLDVNDVTEYSAFLLPNPYRLIIDIHGGEKSGDKGAAKASAAPAAQDLPENAMPNTLSKPSAGGAATTAAKGAPAGNAAAQRVATEVPSTVAVRNTASTTHEVDALSQQIDKVEATPAPTSQPIAVVSNPKALANDTAAHKSKRTARESVPSSTAMAAGSTSMTAADVSAKRTAAPTAEGERSLMRALGLKIGRIVIDPGHGGYDAGTLGAGGIMEKDVVLDVALRLGKLLHDHLGAEIIYTRSDDTFIPLETRTAIANKAEADLFISVHANSSPDATARGVETYYLNFTSQPDALDVAARENAVSDQSVHELSTMVKRITLKDKIDESREFAQDVEQSLYDGLQRGNAGLKNRGVKKAPFVVLIGANMPSILTEISFVTNPQDAAELRTGDYRERVAESIYRGIARYAQGLGGMRVAAAQKSPEPAN